MGAKKDKKERSNKKGKANVKRRKVNQPEEIPEHSDVEEVEEEDQ